MSGSLRSRIEALEAGLPCEIILTLENGETYRHPGPALKFFTEGMEQIRYGGGPILDAAYRTVEAKGCGALWQLLAAGSRIDPISELGDGVSAPSKAPSQEQI